MDNQIRSELNPHTEIEKFLGLMRKGSVQAYNEISLQCELMVFLRRQLPSSWNVELERNVSHFHLQKTAFLKHEIDITVYRGTEKHCIELKFPQQGQVPEQMFKACKDIRFLEQLVGAGFTSGLLLVLTPDPLFYTPHGNDIGLYAMFRCGQEVAGNIVKPTGKKDESFVVSGSYPICWKTIAGKLKYCTVKVKVLPRGPSD